MFKKIIEKLKFGSCKTNLSKDVDAFKESKKDKVEWNTIAENVNSSGKEIQILLIECWFMKKLTKEEIEMVTCNKCYNEHHDQCMGKAGMFDCGCKGCKK